MSDELKIIQNDDGTFSEYDDTFDITIHCQSEEEQNEVLAKLNAPQWIPVETALPEVGSEVLVCFDFKGKRNVYISHFYGDGEFHGLDDEYLTTEGREYRKAVAWMPLPQPYKSEGE